MKNAARNAAKNPKAAALVAALDVYMEDAADNSSSSQPGNE